MTELPPTVRAIFVSAGWYSGRKVAIPAKIPLDHPAASILGEFGGLTVGRIDKGEECATSNVKFSQVSLDESLVNLWNGLLQTNLIGVGEYHNSHGELYIDTIGRWFAASVVNDAFCFEGSSFVEAMERLLLGRRCRPLLQPNQKQVEMYGETYMADHPGIYRYT